MCISEYRNGYKMSYCTEFRYRILRWQMVCIPEFQNVRSLSIDTVNENDVSTCFSPSILV